jgi:NAD(P)-dependent dehydrogenase (short-subunit alcohol dehydrogenase family)
MRIDWDLARMGPQHGKRVLITGANGGIGYEAALQLARQGATVVLACRHQGKTEQAVQRIRQAVPGAMLEVSPLDLGTLFSVRAAAQRELDSGQPLHLLINNAGVMAPPRRLETEDGFELQFGTNVLGHFLLTALLLPALEQAPAARVVTLASVAHKRGQLRFEDLQWQSDYDPGASYAQSKLANLMLALELDRRLRAANSPVISVACHPGVANTRLFVTGDYRPLERAIRHLASFLIGLLLNSQRQGALPTLFAATAEQVVGGGYYGPQGFREMRGGDVGEAWIAPQARDQEAAARLWEVCEELCGQRLLPQGSG